MTTLNDDLPLPCGATLPNRLVKSAMSEALASPERGPSEDLERLYARWSTGGIGLAITGNVMIDRRALGEPGNVVVEDDTHLEGLQAWAQAAQQHDTRCWVQLNHPGKQSPRFLSEHSVAPSAVPFGPALSSAFVTPRALEDAEVEELVQRFARSAKVCQQAGFSGVQIHGAHGYLVSQFLSGHHNQRTDRWGGDLERRARFVREVYAAIRAAVGPDFPIGIKINSADFQKDGFTEQESTQVITWLAEAGIDLVEVSGGTYEAPAMTGRRQSERTRAREGYFLDFVERVRERVDVPLCVTGGFRTGEGMRQAVEQGATDLIGLARPLAIDPDFPRRVLTEPDASIEVPRIATGIKAVDRMGMFDVTWYEVQLARMGRGDEPAPQMGAWRSLWSTLTHAGMQSFKTRRASSRRP